MRPQAPPNATQLPLNRASRPEPERAGDDVAIAKYEAIAKGRSAQKETLRMPAEEAAKTTMR